MSVCRTDDPARVLAEAKPVLVRDPVRHNVVLTLLHGRVASPEPGRYWIVRRGGEPAGVVFQSPLDYPATLTPMGPEAVAAAIDAIVEAGVDLPGVNAEASTAASFAGYWTERTKSAARPVQGMRIYEVDTVLAPARSDGAVRAAQAGDHELLIDWFQAFRRDVGEPPAALDAVVDNRIAAGELWVWENATPGAPVAAAGVFGPSVGVARIGPVYTPPEQRNRGYATALVAALSRRVLDRGHRCILYTDLANPTSNSIYRALGYRAVCEGLRYQFDR